MDRPRFVPDSNARIASSFPRSWPVESKVAKVARKTQTPFGDLGPHSGTLDCDGSLEEVDSAADTGKKCLPAGRVDDRSEQCHPAAEVPKEKRAGIGWGVSVTQVEKLEPTCSGSGRKQVGGIGAERIMGQHELPEPRPARRTDEHANALVPDVVADGIKVS